MGLYITAEDDILEKGGLTDSDVESIITAWEDYIHAYCGDIFCTWSEIHEDENYVFKYRGSDSSVVFVDMLIPYNIVSISKIEYIDYDLTIEEIDDDYEYNEYSITNLDSIWTRTRRENYKVTCDIGNDETDLNGNTNPRYKPEGLKRVLITLVTRDIANMYGQSVDGTSGTTTIDTDKLKSYEFDSETAFDYRYIRKSVPKQIDVSNPFPTGIPSVDAQLRMLQKRDIKLFISGDNYSRRGNLDDVSET